LAPGAARLASRVRGRALVGPEMTECKGERPAVVALLSRDRGIENPVIVIISAHACLRVRRRSDRDDQYAETKERKQKTSKDSHLVTFQISSRLPPAGGNVGTLVCGSRQWSH
jgi:hypothetical protein